VNRCNNNHLHLKGMGRRGQNTKKKSKKEKYLNNCHVQRRWGGGGEVSAINGELPGGIRAKEWRGVVQNHLHK